MEKKEKEQEQESFNVMRTIRGLQSPKPQRSWGPGLATVNLAQAAQLSLQLNRPWGVR